MTIASKNPETYHGQVWYNAFMSWFCAKIAKSPRVTLESPTFYSGVQTAILRKKMMSFREICLPLDCKITRMKNYMIEIRWAFIFTVATMLWAGIEKLFGMHDANLGTQPVFSMLFAVPAIAIYAMAMFEKKQKVYNGKMSWKDGTISGIVLSLFIAVLSPVAQWAIFELISPDFFAKATQFYTDKKILTQTRALEMFNIQAYMKKSITESLSMGVITAAIVALIVQSKKPKP